MNRRQLPLALVATVVVALAAVVGIIAGRGSKPIASVPSAGPYRGSEPPAGIVAAGFRLRGYRGHTVSMRAERGKVVLLSFVDSKCTESCPIVTSVIAQSYGLLPPEKRPQVVPLLISVQPRVDTPVRVHRFLAHRHALALDYLIGSIRKLRPVWKAYGILPAVDTGNADVHSSDVRVIDRHGIWVATQHAGVDLTPNNLAHDALEALDRS